jgi:outer membrane protein assembly factor BamB
LYTVAINRKDGSLLWQDSIVPKAYYRIHALNSYANPTVVSNGEMLYSHFPGYGLVAYNLEGEKLWEFKHPPIRHSLGGASSPVIKDSLVIFISRKKNNIRIEALDCNTGKPAWFIRDTLHNLPDPSTKSSPVLWNDLIILHQFNTIAAYNTKNGSAEWWIDAPSTGTSTPVIQDDMVYVGAWTNMGEDKVRGTGLNFENLIQRFDQNKNLKLEKGEVPDSVMMFQRPDFRNASGTSFSFNRLYDYNIYDQNSDEVIDSIEWKSILEVTAEYMGDHGMLAIPLQGNGARSYADIRWKINEDTPETPSPLVIGENILFIKNGGVFTVINRESGDIVKKDRIAALGPYLSSPILAGNRIYTCSYNGVVSVLSADDFRVLAYNKLREKIGASPVAVDNVLYLRTNKHLYAFMSSK